MSRSRIRENHPHRLLVEGTDDLFTVIELTGRHGHSWDRPAPDLPYVQATDGFGGMAAAFRVASKSYARVGIVADADYGTDRWRQIRAMFADAGVDPPRTPPADGVVIESADPNRPVRIGAWLMPDNVARGELEDFLTTLIPADDPCWEFAAEAVAGARLRGAPVSARRRAKSTLHTWLAWRENPGVPFGTAMRSGYLRHDSPIAQVFLSWFRRMFTRD